MPGVRQTSNAVVQTNVGVVSTADILADIRNQYLVDDFTTSIWPDSVGPSDIDTINGLTFDSNAFGGSGGVVGDGSDDAQSDTMDAFGSDMSGDFALSIRFNTTDDGGEFLGTLNDGTASIIEVGTSSRFDSTAGRLYMALRDEDGNEISAETSAAVDDGTDKVFIINKTGNSASDIEIYSDATTDVSSPLRNAAFSNPGDFDYPMSYFSRNDRETISGRIAATLGTVRWFGDSLDQSERQAVFDLYA